MSEARCGLLGLGAAYALWVYLTDGARYRTADWGSKGLLRAVYLMSRAYLRVLGITFEERFEADYDDGRRYLVAATPHGAFAASGVWFAAPHTRLAPEGRPPELYGVSASVLFYVPVLRELILLMRARDVSGANFDALLRARKSVVMVPGGMHEQVHPRTACARHVPSARPQRTPPVRAPRHGRHPAGPRCAPTTGVRRTTSLGGSGSSASRCATARPLYRSTASARTSCMPRGSGYVALGSRSRTRPA